MAGVSITDELREFKGRINAELAPEMVLALRAEINCIADHIDEQFDRICAQHEVVLQETIDEVVEEYEYDRLPDQLRIEKLEKQRDHWHQQATDMMNHADAMEHERDDARERTDELSDELLRVRRERDELRAKIDEYDRTHVELPRDANGNVFRLGCTVRILWRNPRVLLTVYDMTMCQDGEWMILAGDGDGYSCNLETSSYEVCNDVCHENNDTAESIVRDLSMGSITESQAVERISALNGNGKR